MSENIREQVRKSQLDSETTNAAWINGYTLLGGKVFCADNCSNCCSLAVNCTWPETLGISDAITDDSLQRLKDHLKQLRAILAMATDFKSYLKMHRQEVGPCPFLVRGSCSIYQARPFSCRALLATKESFWCGADFTAMSSEEKRAFVNSLDTEVVLFPMHYVAATQEYGRDLESRISATMAQHFGFSLYGNLPLMVLLNSEYDLENTVRKGHEVTVALLEQEGLHHPYLVTLSGH
ncbi:YkgJ family cysteine cluster protein [Geobacter pelophilus]|uniref:YkgJ family cysteine cluster protein n=1 Tax=Geoanaerobacter pelophilus TaxID=60036 RepID=A0AAW4LDU6_9BACT|nr:YkgJ family cysteine cluster protein [Geoanaerobacter pelophilus]MBT0666067.1 YkgJ family cysteine cluster protein [Geoanaerobacter pelophilus]